MDQIAKLLGMFNVIFLAAAFRILAGKNGRFDLKLHNFSDLGEDERRGWIFNLVLAVFAVIQIIFAAMVCRTVENFSSFGFLVGGGVALALAGVFTVRKHRLLHGAMVFSSAVSESVGVTILALGLMADRPYLGGALLTATAVLLVSFVIKSFCRGGRWELVLFAGVAGWNVLFSLVLI